LRRCALYFRLSAYISLETILSRHICHTDINSFNLVPVDFCNTLHFVKIYGKVKMAKCSRIIATFARFVIGFNIFLLMIFQTGVKLVQLYCVWNICIKPDENALNFVYSCSVISASLFTFVIISSLIYFMQYLQYLPTFDCWVVSINLLQYIE